MTEVGGMRVGELLGRVRADEHADLSRDAGCCLAQQGREAEVTAATDAGDGQRNPGPARAASPPRRTPRRPQPLLSQPHHPVAAQSQPCPRDVRQSRQWAPRRRGQLG
jgi:hypothetical protein